MANEDIKTVAKQKRVALWEVADYLGMHESVLSRKLRHELSDGEKATLIIAIEYIKKRRDAETLSAIGLNKNKIMSMTKEELIKMLYGED